jgi:hypothetical protein
MILGMLSEFPLQSTLSSYLNIRYQRKQLVKLRAKRFVGGILAGLATPYLLYQESLVPIACRLTPREP